MPRETDRVTAHWTTRWLRSAFLQVAILPGVWASSTFAQGSCIPDAPLNVRVGVGTGGSFFQPADVTVDCGETVCFVWDANGHTSTADSGAWDSGGQAAGFTFGVTFNSPAANVPYHCDFHGAAGGIGMSGVIHVRNNCGNPSTPTRTRTPRPTRTPTATATSTRIPGPTSAPFERSSSSLALLAVSISICALALPRLRRIERRR